MATRHCQNLPGMVGAWNTNPLTRTACVIFPATWLCPKLRYPKLYTPNQIHHISIISPLFCRTIGSYGISPSLRQEEQKSQHCRHSQEGRNLAQLREWQNCWWTKRKWRYKELDSSMISMVMWIHFTTSKIFEPRWIQMAHVYWRIKPGSKRNSTAWLKPTSWRLVDLIVDDWIYCTGGVIGHIKKWCTHWIQSSARHKDIDNLCRFDHSPDWLIKSKSTRYCWFPPLGLIDVDRFGSFSLNTDFWSRWTSMLAFKRQEKALCTWSAHLSQQERIATKWWKFTKVGEKTNKPISMKRLSRMVIQTAILVSDIP